MRSKRARKTSRRPKRNWDARLSSRIMFPLDRVADRAASFDRLRKVHEYNMVSGRSLDKFAGEAAILDGARGNAALSAALRIGAGRAVARSTVAEAWGAP